MGVLFEVLTSLARGEFGKAGISATDCIEGTVAGYH